MPLFGKGFYIMEHYKNLSLENIWYYDLEGNYCEERWLPVKDYEGLYEVSDLGRIKSLPKYHGNGTKKLMPIKILKSFSNPKGYRIVDLPKNGRRRTTTVHRVVATTFLHPPILMRVQINHKDLVKHNNTADNLEFVTNRENMSHYYLNSAKKTSQYIGVCFVPRLKKKPFEAKIKIGGKTLYLGRFANEIDAHNAYKKRLAEVLLNNDNPK